MLPVLEIESQITSALGRSNRLVLTAPTGSGKTTQVPQILLRGGVIDGQTIVLQPRRLATRMVAQRVAREIGCALGAEVGYQTRHDSKIGPRTRIRFVTEGLFLRMIQSDPLLQGVGAVVLDEFHERSIAADVSLGLVRMLQESDRPRARGDLRLLVMSATLDAQAVASYMKCPTLAAGGRLHPIEVRYLPRRSQSPPWDQAAEALCLALDEQTGGDVLVFMPGVYEINRTIEACRRSLGGAAQQVQFFPLHGTLSPAQQDAAVAPSNQRKVIVATNVAQTSITIEGIRCVIDSGLARVHRFDAERGINVLRVEPISRAAADQRTGRAGRTGPGLCLRLWTEPDHHQVREEHDAPEVLRIELAEPLLQLRAMGIENASDFPWLDAPPSQAIERAEDLLRTLGALDGGILTHLGRRMAAVPTHPRLSRMLIEAADRGCLARAARWAALIGERDILLRSAEVSRFVDPTDTPSDLAVRERALAQAAAVHFDPRRCDALGIHANTARQVEQTAILLLTASRAPKPPSSAGTTPDLIRALLAAYPDHIAVRHDPSRPHCAMPGRKRVTLDPTSIVTAPGPLLAVELHEIGRGENVETVLSLASAIDPGWLDPARMSSRVRTAWNEQAQAVEQIEERLYGELVIDSITRPVADSAAAAEMLVERIISGELKLERWDEQVLQWIERTRCAANWFPERSLIRYEPDDVRVILHELVSGATRFSQVRDRPCLEPVRNALSWEDQQFVERMAPAAVQLPGGYRMKLIYDSAPGSPPRGRAKIKDLYGLTETPRIAAGRQRIILEILAPNSRPIQVTADLANFWKTLYPQMRNELRRRYPKHDWR